MYFDAKTYFEIALLLNPDYKEARQNLGKVEESIKNASHAKNNKSYFWTHIQQRPGNAIRRDVTVFLFTLQ